MLNYFFTDANGQRQGPFNDQMLRVLVAQKKILPSTPLETDGGHTGLAGHIPGLFVHSGIPVPQVQTVLQTVPQPVPQSIQRQFFCTNCGNTISERAVACMSCGVKPTGHKGFCRQCGIALNPGQVVCTQCGAKLSGMPDLSSIPDTAKGLILAVGIIVVAVVGVWFVVSNLNNLNFSGGGNPLKKAKVGDWAKYNVVVSTNDKTEKATIKVEVLSNDGKTVEIRSRVTPGPFGKPLVLKDEIDLSKTEEELLRANMKKMVSGELGLEDVTIKVEKGKNTKETLTVDGKKFNCVVKPYTVKVTTGDVTFSVQSKVWTSKTAPLDGIVRNEVRTKLPSDMGGMETFTMTISLSEFGRE